MVGGRLEGATMHELPERYNVSQLLDEALAAGCADKPAFLHGDAMLTYGALMERVCRMGNALRDLGVRREERVLLLLDDAPAFPVAFFGATRIGAVPVPVNPRYRAEDFRFFLRDSEARVLVVEDAYLPALEEALLGQRDRVQVITTGSAQTADHQLETLLASARPDLSPADTHRDDMAFWLYSSGSTGHPKGVVHLHRSVPYTCQTYARQVLDIAEDDLVYGRVLYHAYGLGNALTFPLWARATSVLDASRPSPAGVLDAVQRFRPTLLCLVPTLYNAVFRPPSRCLRKRCGVGRSASV
jgi:acyl-coenzyme A synthetase/AMP-(fatty) acid ligase